MNDLNLSSAENMQSTSCVSYRLRRAGRIAAKFYDNALKPSGLRNTQFTLIASLKRLGETNIGDLAETLATDATTLTRNLEILVRRGLIENVEAEDGRVRYVRLTDLGHQKFKEAVPLWRTAQRRVLKALEPEPWAVMAEQLAKIETACDVHS